ncbi:SigE family RNA polymerase sigma factor [Kribbella deserti]|uniref:SigE family RNA polymerase sigma factor n=1 Tax=Kribbella deserti TaxID=1926257 RepID=A0ABV6QNU8_9ACTN
MSGEASVDAAIARMYAEHWISLLRLAVLLVDDRQSAEDVVQEAFAQLYRRWDRLDDRGSALAYLRSTVLNRSRSVLRRRRVARGYIPPVMPPDASAEHAAVMREDRQEVHRAVSALPTRVREVLVLRYYLDLPHSEIARTLGISESTARSTASRGIALLGQKLKDLR